VKVNRDIFWYKGKMVISGYVIEIYSYEKGVYLKRRNNGRAGNGFTSDEEKEKNRQVVLMRARRDLRRIVNANFGQWGNDVTCKFVTLTFRENVTDIDAANYEFKKFVKRLNYAVYGKKCSGLKYTVVLEFQERGAVHYHVIFYNLPYTKADVLGDVWGNGFIKVNKIDEIDNVGAYVCKYLTKGNNDDRLRGRKCYFNSRGLKKPIEKYFDCDEMESAKKSLPAERMTFRCEFENEYTGKIIYEQYNISENNCKKEMRSNGKNHVERTGEKSGRFSVAVELAR